MLGCSLCAFCPCSSLGLGDPWGLAVVVGLDRGGRRTAGALAKPRPAQQRAPMTRLRHHNRLQEVSKTPADGTTWQIKARFQAVVDAASSTAQQQAHVAFKVRQAEAEQAISLCGMQQFV